MRDICRAFRNDRFPYPLDDRRYYNVQLMKARGPAETAKMSGVNAG